MVTNKTSKISDLACAPTWYLFIEWQHSHMTSITVTLLDMRWWLQGNLKSAQLERRMSLKTSRSLRNLGVQGYTSALWWFIPKSNMKELQHKE